MKRQFRKNLKKNKEILAEGEKIINEIMGYIKENQIKNCNPLANNKLYEILVCALMLLCVNEEEQGPDAVDEKNDNVWEIKCVGANNGGLSFSFQNFKTFKQLEEWFFKKVEGKPFESGKLSGGLLACRKLPLNEGFGFLEIIECNMRDVWDNLLREKIKKDFKSGKRFSSSIDYNKLKNLIVGEPVKGKILGKVYNREQIKSFGKNLLEKQQFLFNKVDELVKLFSEAWVAREENKYRLEFEQGVNPLAKNDLNEFRAAVRTNSLMMAGIGPDAIDENKNYYEFKVLAGKSARLDWGSVSDTWEEFFKYKVTKKFMWNGKSIRYYIFTRKGQKFTDCYVAEGSELLGNDEVVKRIETSYNTIGDRKTKKIYLSLSFLNNPLFTNVPNVLNIA